MIPTSQYVQRVYLLLTLLSTLAASFIWGVNTIFLLDAGLSNAEAFAANAFFTLGQVIFEIPTGVLADTRGRRTSYALGVFILLISTFIYFWLWHIHGPFWAWGLVSVLLGFGFTFFSGATEAWLVDSLHFSGYKGNLDSVFAKGQAIGGVAMLVGSVSGGIVAQYTDLGMPYILRVVTLGITFVVCLVFMKDWGFVPQKEKTPLKQIQLVLSASIENGWRNPPVRWMMLASPFVSGVSFYIFYAMQPHLLKLYGDPEAYTVAGLVAAIVAGAQIVGGLSIKFVRKLFTKRTSLMIAATILAILIVFLLGIVQNFWIAIILLVLWGLISAVVYPVRSAYMNGLIESKQRATVLSFDSLVGNTGGIVTQPILGKAADVQGYPFSFLIGSIVQLGSIPFLMLAKKENAVSDTIEKEEK